MKLMVAVTVKESPQVNEISHFHFVTAVNSPKRKTFLTKHMLIVADLVILIIGAILMLIGLLMLAYYVRAERRRKNCPCFPSKEQRMARQLRENQAGNGQVGPCTDDNMTPQGHQHNDEHLA